MPRGKYTRKSKVTAITHHGHKAETNLVPEQVFTELKFWNDLSDTEKSTIKTEGEQLAVAMLNYGRSRLAIGEHLLNIQTILEPKNLFTKFLKTVCHFNVRTAYRYINGYRNAKAMLPEPILKAAMARGYNILGETEEKPLGIYTEVAKALPIPKDVSTDQANVWLDQAETLRKQAKSVGTVTELQQAVAVPQDPETLLKETIRFVENRFRKLPINSKVRANWMKSLIGMELTILGVGNQQTLTPIAIPQDFKAERGRPRVQRLEATA